MTPKISTPVLVAYHIPFPFANYHHIYLILPSDTMAAPAEMTTLDISGKYYMVSFTFIPNLKKLLSTHTEQDSE